MTRRSTPELDAAARAGITALAEDVGRLSRVLPADPMASYPTMIVVRIAEHVVRLDALLGPCASDLLLVAGFDDQGVEAALAAVDERDVELGRLLGIKRAGCVT